MSKFGDIAITSLETITAFDPVTGAYQFTLDELQNGSIAQSEEKTDITGKSGRKLTSLKRNKSISISASNGLVSAGLMEIQTGGKFEEKATEVMWTDYLVVNSSTATTSYKAVGTTGAEIETLYVRNSDGTLGDPLEQNAATGAGKFTYSPTTKELAFSDEITDGTEIVVYYKRKIIANTLDNKSDRFSGKSTLYIDALGEDKCNNIYRVQIFVPKADVSGEFSFDMGDSQTMHSFNAEAMAGACGAGSNFFTYTVFGVNASDAV